MRTMPFLDYEASVLALGTMNFGGSIDEGLAFAMTDAYLEAGGNVIDTARIYGDFAHEIQGGSEQVIGRWAETNKKREEIILVTKGGHPNPHAMHTGRLSRKEVLSDIRKSLDALRTDHVDLYLLHRDDPSLPVEAILEVLTELVEEGYTKFVGVSNWRADRIREALDTAAARGLAGPAADQAQFSLARQAVVEDDTLVQVDAAHARLHEETGMPLMCFTSQAKGFLTKLAEKGPDALPDKAKRRYLTEENIGILSRAEAVSRQTGLSVNTVALAYLTSQPFPAMPVVGASSLEQLRENLKAGDARLTREQTEYLRKL